MELRYRGQTYSVQDNQIETINLKQIAYFLGQRYHLRRPIKTKTFKSTLGLRKYRGAVYGD